jgi:SAM-dependent methyltransferase
MRLLLKKSVWDQYWKESDRINVEKIIEDDPFYRLFKRLIRLQKNEKLDILEVGCGSGIRTLALLRDFEDYPLDATLVDTSVSALLLAKKNAEGNKLKANFILADGFKLPFPKTFDIVWNEGVNEHFTGERRRRIFEEMSRVCKKRGQVIVIVPNTLNLPYRLTKRMLEASGRWIYGFERPYTIFELKDRMKNAHMTSPVGSGAGVISPIFTLLQLIPKRVQEKMGNSSKENDRLAALKKVFRQTENACEKLFGSFLAKDIGAEGTNDW